MNGRTSGGWLGENLRLHRFLAHFGRNTLGARWARHEPCHDVEARASICVLSDDKLFKNFLGVER